MANWETKRLLVKDYDLSDQEEMRSLLKIIELGARKKALSEVYKDKDIFLQATHKDTKRMLKEIYLKNGKLIGFMEIFNKTPHPYSSYVNALFFLPEYQGKGFGKEVKDRLFDELRKSGVKQVLSSYNKNNTQAKRHQESIGMTPTGITWGNNIEMHKQLNSTLAGKIKENLEKQGALWNRDHELLNIYRQDPQPTNLMNLYNHVKPIMSSEVSKWTSINLPRPLLEAEAFKYFKEAADTYNPDSKAKFGTHLRNQLLKLNRFGATYSGLIKIPENRVFKIKEYKDALGELGIDGAPADPSLVASYLSWPIKEVQRMQNELRTDLLQSGTEFDSSVDLYGKKEMGSKQFYHSLTAKQKTIYDYTIGEHGKSPKTVDEIAASLGTSAAAVSKTRKSIAKKLERILYYNK